MEKDHLRQSLSTAHQSEIQMDQLPLPVHRAKTLVPSLLTRLSNRQTNNPMKVPLQERLSDKSRPWWNHSGQGRSKSRRLSTGSVKSLPMSQQVVSNSNLTHSKDIPQHWKESRLSLLDRINMEHESPHPLSENKRHEEFDRSSPTLEQ